MEVRILPRRLCAGQYRDYGGSVSRKLRGLGLLLFVGVVAACEPAITDGVVVEKVHEKERHYTTIMPVGKVMMPVFHTDSEDWVLIIQGRNRAGEYRMRRLYVSRRQWENAKVLDRWYAERNAYSDPEG
jgi:hypothetical protein